jgi:hypothetical protein
VKVEITNNLARALDASQDRMDSITASMLGDIGHEFVMAARAMAGAGPYGRSFRVDPQITLGVSGRGLRAGSDSPMAAIIERGRKPGHAPSIASLTKRSRSGAAGKAGMAERIGRRGTKGRWVVKKANAQIKADGTMNRIAGNGLRAITDLGG